MTDSMITFVAEETFGLFLRRSRDDCPDKVTGQRHHDDQEEQNLSLWRAEHVCVQYAKVSVHEMNF